MLSPDDHDDHDDHRGVGRPSNARRATMVVIVCVAFLALLISFGVHRVRSHSAARDASSSPATLGTPAPFVRLPEGTFGTASSTGVPAGTILTDSGPLRISKAGTVVSGLNIKGTVYITASNVTIRNSRIAGAGYWIVRADDGVTGTVIENSEINGLGVDGLDGSNGVGGAVTIQGCNIYGVENAIVPSSGSVIRDNYIHDLKAPGSPHYDGIQMDGDQSNIAISGNTIDERELNQTSTIMMDNDFGPVSNITITGNRLLGAGYTVYSDGRFNSNPLTNITITNNRFFKGGFGYTSFDNSTPSFAGNVDDQTGQPISAQ